MNQEDRVRALLAEQGSAATGEQIPAEVADRLEDTLALLVAERSAERSSAGSAEREVPGGGPAVPLHRRWLPRSLVAAAAVVILGVGGASIAGLGGLGGLGSGVSTSSDAGGAAPGSAGDSSGEAGSDFGSDSGGATTDQGPAESLPSGNAPRLQRDLVTGEVPTLRSQSFARDVRRLLAVGSANGRSAAPASPEASPDSSPDSCPRVGPRHVLQIALGQLWRHWRVQWHRRRRRVRRSRPRAGRDQHPGAGRRRAGSAGGAPGGRGPAPGRGVELRRHHPAGHDHRGPLSRTL